MDTFVWCCDSPQIIVAIVAHCTSPFARLFVCSTVCLSACQWVWSQLPARSLWPWSVAQQSSLSVSVCHKKRPIIDHGHHHPIRFPCLRPRPRPRPCHHYWWATVKSSRQSAACSRCAPLGRDNIFCNKFLTAPMRPRMSCASQCWSATGTRCGHGLTRTRMDGLLGWLAGCLTGWLPVGPCHIYHKFNE